MWGKGWRRGLKEGFVEKWWPRGREVPPQPGGGGPWGRRDCLSKGLGPRAEWKETRSVRSAGASSRAIFGFCFSNHGKPLRGSCPPGYCAGAEHRGPE